MKRETSKSFIRRAALTLLLALLTSTTARAQYVVGVIQYNIYEIVVTVQGYSVTGEIYINIPGVEPSDGKYHLAVDHTYTISVTGWYYNPINYEMVPLDEFKTVTIAGESSYSFNIDSYGAELQLNRKGSYTKNCHEVTYAWGYSGVNYYYEGDWVHFYLRRLQNQAPPRRAWRTTDVDGVEEDLTMVYSRTDIDENGMPVDVYICSFYMPDYGVTIFVDWWTELQLNDDASNASTLAANDGQAFYVKLSGRTLYKDGDWNSLCLPFDVNDGNANDNISFTGTPLEGATVMELDTETAFKGQKTGFDGGTLYLNFRAANSIVAGRPYIVKWPGKHFINSEADWENFAAQVNDGTFPNMIVYLGADISVTTMVGTADHPFSGIFDGAGHTLDVSITDEANQGTAPFRYISNATIQNLKVTGTVTGNLHCAGLVGFASGRNEISQCEVAASVTCSGGSHSHCGGILGHGATSTTTITDCLFSGAISGTTTATGIIYGWGDGGGWHTITNCLFDGTCTGCNGIDLLKKNGGAEDINNCYKTQDIGTQGTYMTYTSGTGLAAWLGDNWLARDGKVVPKMDIVIEETIVEPVFGGVTIDATAPAAVTSEDGELTFTGQYDLYPVEADNTSVLNIGSGNAIGHAMGRTLHPFRAHFELNNSSNVKGCVMNFGGDETAINIPLDDKWGTKGRDVWYTLDGMKLERKPTQKGIYINNGLKIKVK